LIVSILRRSRKIETLKKIYADRFLMGGSRYRIRPLGKSSPPAPLQNRQSPILERGDFWQTSWYSTQAIPNGGIPLSKNRDLRFLERGCLTQRDGKHMYGDMVNTWIC
jgi:hypothetical protein